MAAKLSIARLRRLVLIGSVIAVALVAGLFAFEQIPRRVLLKGELAFLVVLEFAYIAVSAACFAGVLALTPALVRSRRRRPRGPWPARGLLLCASVLVGLLACEAASAVVRMRRGRGSAVPDGGFREADRARVKAPIPKGFDPVDLPTEFPGVKDPREINIAVLGESSAAGIPYSLFDISPLEIVRWRLEREIPGRRFSLSMVADSGHTLERQHHQLKTIRRRPDALVVYCGHNEFSARLPASRDLLYYRDDGEPTAWERCIGYVEATSPFCGLVRGTADTIRVSIPPPAWRNRSLVDKPAYTTAEYEALLSDFRRRLEEIIAYAERLGAIPILIVPPANDADFEPSRSFLPPDVLRAGRSAFAREFADARRLEETDPAESIRRYRILADRYPGFAETWFRLGRLAERAGAWDEAYRNYLAARDLDGMPMRCLTAFQDVYRELAARHRCILIDGQACFHAVARHGLLDDDLFHDGMHPSLRGQVSLAQAVLSALHARRAFGWPAGAPAPRVDAVEVARRYKLGKDAWNKICHWGIMFYSATSTARYDPSERVAKQDAFGKAADKIAAGAPPESVGLPNIGIPEPAPTTSVAAPRASLAAPSG